MCPSAFRVSSPQAQGARGGGQTYTKTFLGQVGMCVENFIKIGSGVWISTSPPHTNRQTNKHLCAHFYIDRAYAANINRAVNLRHQYDDWQKNCS